MDKQLLNSSNWFITEHCTSLTGLRYKLVCDLSIPQSVCHRDVKKNKGGLVLDMSNHLYKIHQFKYAYCPQVDFGKRCKQGEKQIEFVYFFNDVSEAKRLGFIISDTLVKVYTRHQDQMQQDGYPSFSSQYYIKEEVNNETN